MFFGTELTIFDGLLVWFVSLMEDLDSSDKSIVLLSCPFFLGRMTLGAHHVSGVTIGTFSMMPLFESNSKPQLTWSHQWRGTDLGF